MSGGAVALIMNAVFGVAFFAAFIVLFMRDKRYLAPAWFAAMFATGLMAGAAEGILPSVSAYNYASWAILVLMALSHVFMTIGVSCLYKVRVPFAVIGSALFATVALNWLVMDASRDSLSYMAVRQGSYAALQAITIWLVWRVGRKSVVDRLLLVTLGLCALQYLARPAIGVLVGGAGSTAPEFLATNYAIVLLIVFAVSMIAVSFSLLILCIGEITNHLRLEAHEDQATGLLNRRGFEDAIDTHLAKNGLKNHTHAIVIADIDHFKSVNDTYGHDAGDAVLIAFGALLKQAAGPNNLAVRMGGEEFIMVLWNTPVETAHMVAEGLRTALSMVAHDAMGGRSVSASFGIAYWQTDEALDTALRSADRALYRAKDKGRNRVERAAMPDYDMPKSLSA